MTTPTYYYTRREERTTKKPNSKKAQPYRYRYSDTVSNYILIELATIQLLIN